MIYLRAWICFLVSGRLYFDMSVKEIRAVWRPLPVNVCLHDTKVITAQSLLFLVYESLFVIVDDELADLEAAPCTEQQKHKRNTDRLLSFPNEIRGYVRPLRLEPVNINVRLNRFTG
jgi:hypothetical protein